MDIVNYCAFLERFGKKVTWVNGVPFYPYRRGFLWSIPQFISYSVEPSKFQRLVWKSPLGVFYSSKKFGRQRGSIWVLKGPEYGLECLHPKKRNQVRRGLERCEVREVDWEVLKRDGLQMNRETLSRQGRRSGRLDDAKWWERQCSVSAEFRDVRAWGAFINDNFAGYVYGIVYDGISEGGTRNRVASIIHAGSYSRFLRSEGEYAKCYPNDTLMYTVVKGLIDVDNCAYVVNGFKRGDDSGLAAWKRHLGFKEESYMVELIANPVLALAGGIIPQFKKFLQ